MRFVLYAGHVLIDANLPTLVALRERLRLEVARQPSAMADLHVLVFNCGDGRYLGRLNVVLEDGQPVLALPGRPPGDGSETTLEHALG